MYFNGSNRETVYLGIKTETDKEDQSGNPLLDTINIHTLKIPILSFLNSVFSVTDMRLKNNYKAEAGERTRNVFDSTGLI